MILVGSGSSHYAALMARPVLEHAWGTEVTCLVPSEAADARLTADTRCILPFRKAASAPIPMIWSVN